MLRVREPAVAGTFYPAHPEDLRHEVRRFLEGGTAADATPKAIIAPHAGYIYSGPVAGNAYGSLLGARDRVRRVVLIGPAHRVYLEGLAAPSADVFRTPLGDVPVDQESIRELAARFPQVIISDEAHAEEHCLEVQLPFLQEVLAEFAIVPLVVGRASPSEVADVIEALWDGDETCFVISSDLSHYQDLETARVLDADTAARIQRLQPVAGDDACGAAAINGFLEAARRRRLSVSLLDLRTSGDTAGDPWRVVGYGAFRFDAA